VAVRDVSDYPVRYATDYPEEELDFTARVGAYGGLLTDRYPATDEEQAIHVEVDYPDIERDLNRWLPLVKWLFAILFTGRYPRGRFDYVVGVNRWALGVEGYAVLFVTDRYPPFSMQWGGMLALR